MMENATHTLNIFWDTTCESTENIFFWAANSDFFVGYI